MSTYYYSTNYEDMLSKYEFNERPRSFIKQLPRQMMVRNMISLNTIYDNILLYWSVGTGKSLGAISIAEGFKEYLHQMGRKVLVLVKNSNIEMNFINELENHEYLNYITPEEKEIINNPNYPDVEEKESLKRAIKKRIRQTYDILTYGVFHNKVKKGEIKNMSNTVIIIDEVHNITGRPIIPKDEDEIYFSLINVLKKSYNYRMVLLSATPIYDNVRQIFEISNLLNMNQRSHLLPIREQLFSGERPLLKRKITDTTTLFTGYIPEITEEGNKRLGEALKGKISYLTYDETGATFPKKIDMGVPVLGDTSSIKVVYCEMSEFQYLIHQQAMETDKLQTKTSFYENSRYASTLVYPDSTYYKIGFKNHFVLVGKEYRLKPEYNSILTTELNKYSCKLYQLLQNILNNKQDPNKKGPVFIYSQFVNYAGIELIKQMLKMNGYIEGSNGSNCFQLYDDIKTPSIRNSILKTFNSDENKFGDKIHILIGSKISSEGLTFKNVRQVHILEPTWNMSSIDQIIGRAVRHKSHEALPEENRNVEIYKYCAVYQNEICIDKEQYILIEEKHRSNIQVNTVLKQVSFDCNLNNEKLKCEIIPHIERPIDKSTYNLYIDFFDKFDIEYNIHKIKELFKKYYIWSLDNIIEYIKSKPGTDLISNESIIRSLKLMIEQKMLIIDSLEREGYIIEKDDLYVFNPSDIPLQTSIYSKTLDFAEKRNIMTLTDFVSQKSKQPTSKKLTSDSNTFEEEIARPKEKSTEEVVLSKKDIQFNQSIIDKFNDSQIMLYGSYREKGIEGKFGPIDGKFRIIENILPSKKAVKRNDQREIKTGMVATSYDKQALLDIINQAKIPHPKFAESVKKKLLITIIENYLKQHNLILK
jgi:superfamily II DNA or RNA helicase